MHIGQPLSPLPHFHFPCLPLYTLTILPSCLVEPPTAVSTIFATDAPSVRRGPVLCQWSQGSTARQYINPVLHPPPLLEARVPAYCNARPLQRSTGPNSRFRRALLYLLSSSGQPFHHNILPPPHSLLYTLTGPIVCGLLATIHLPGHITSLPSRNPFSALIISS